MIKVITKRDLIKSVKERWHDHYNFIYDSDEEKRRIYEHLDILKLETCDEIYVTAIIGNDSWTSLECDECNKQQDSIIRLGDEPDYEVSTIFICKECLEKALKLL